MSSGSEDEVQFQVLNNKGIIRLNRPKALNALNASMASEIFNGLKSWNESEKLDFVLIDGKGDKAFCAGGDVRSLTDAKPEAGASKSQKDFFSTEYRVNHLIGTLDVPFVAIIHGITMGGGVGLSVHGKYRVASEKSIFAMPETLIGLFPDVGGSYFLPRLRGWLGMYLALVGPQLKGIDCLDAGIATHMCASERLPEMREQLIGGSASELEKTLNRFTSEFPWQTSSSTFLRDVSLVDRYFSADSLDEIFERLSDAAKNGEPFAAQTLDKLQKCSPTSLQVTFRQMREGSKLQSLKECLEMEYRIAVRCCEGDDFYEGVRAALVDKDNSPKWNPPTLDAVTDEMVDRHFSRLHDGCELRL